MKLSRTKLHQLWYQSGTDGLIGLPFDAKVDAYVKELLSGSVAMLPFAVYWRRYAQFMAMGCHQVYFGYHGHSYWVVESHEIDSDNFFIEGSGGYHIIEIRTDGLGYVWAPESDREAHFDLVVGANDRFLDGEGEPLSDRVCDLINANVELTTRIHDECQQTMPYQSTWTNKDRKALAYPWRNQ